MTNINFTLRAVGLLALLLIVSETNAQETKLKWWGHAAFSITTPNGKVLLIDPWLANPVNPDAQRAVASLAKVDYISHVPVPALAGVTAYIGILPARVEHVEAPHTHEAYSRTCVLVYGRCGPGGKRCARRSNRLFVLRFPVLVVESPRDGSARAGFVEPCGQCAVGSLLCR